MITSAIDLLALISCIVSVAAAVAAAFFSRRSIDPGLQGHLDELTSAVERIATESRREKMRRVRAGAKDSPTDAPEAPPGLLPAAPVPSAGVTKDDLRRHLAAIRR